jgi:hypothetical protein
VTLTTVHALEQPQLTLYFYIRLIFNRYNFGLECNIWESSSSSFLHGTDKSVSTSFNFVEVIKIKYAEYVARMNK